VLGDEMEPASVEQVTPHADQWVQITFLDHGIGIPQENIEKIFDPYFTTKSTGSGLGLATSYSIVRNHGGVLSVKSEPGKGSAFSMFLPAVSDVTILQESHGGGVKMGHGKILIMDDEIQIRKVLGEMVETCGYQALTAKDGAEAIEIFCRAREIHDPF